MAAVIFAVCVRIRFERLAFELNSVFMLALEVTFMFEAESAAANVFRSRAVVGTVRLETAALNVFRTGIIAGIVELVMRLHAEMLDALIFDAVNAGVDTTSASKLEAVKLLTVKAFALPDETIVKFEKEVFEEVNDMIVAVTGT